MQVHILASGVMCAWAGTQWFAFVCVFVCVCVCMCVYVCVCMCVCVCVNVTCAARSGSSFTTEQV